MKKIFLTLCISTIFSWTLEGTQILHTKPNDKSYRTHDEFVQFVETTFKEAIPLESDADVLHYASNQVGISGIFIELGTGLGRTTNFIAALNPQKTIYTFDSYLGHPADWDKGDKILPKDFFAWPADKPLPSFLNNVCLIKGWFVDTLPSFISSQQDIIAFIHVDCEIYESTALALDILAPKIVDGTILVFDELYNYPNYRLHEYKAFQEFLDKQSFEAEYLAFNVFHEQVAIRLHKK